MSKKKILAWIGAGTFLIFTAGCLPVEAAGLETEKPVVPTETAPVTDENLSEPTSSNHEPVIDNEPEPTESESNNNTSFGCNNPFGDATVRFNVC